MNYFSFWLHLNGTFLETWLLQQIDLFISVLSDVFLKAHVKVLTGSFCRLEGKQGVSAKIFLPKPVPTHSVHG
jgi:hypothetical protein